MAQPLPSLERVLVIRCGAMGDLVTSTAVIEALRRQYGEKITIDWITTPDTAALFDKDKRINRVYKLKNRRVPMSLSPKKQKIIRHSERNPYDLLVNLEGGKHFANLAKKICAHHKIGAPYTTHRLPEGRYWHTVEVRKALLAPVVKKKHLTTSFPSLAGTGIKALRKRYGLSEHYIVIAPGNSHTHKQRLNHRAWPEEHWQNLIGRIPASTTVVLVGGPDERALAESLKPFGNSLIDLVGKTPLYDLVGIVEHAQLLLSTDTGPAHIASATATPVCTLIGPTPMESTGPFCTGANTVHILSANLACAPCYKSDVMKNCTRNLCMELIEPTQVYHTIRPYLR